MRRIRSRLAKAARSRARYAQLPGRYVRQVRLSRVPAVSAASPGQRLFALSLDAGISLFGMGVLAATGVVVYRRSPAARRTLRNARPPVMALGRRESPLELPPRWRQAIWAVLAAEAVVGRNWRGPGDRIVRIRRVDARTGGPVTIPSAVVRFAAVQTWTHISARYSAPQRRTAERVRSIGLALEDVQQAHSEDPEEQQQAMPAYYQAHRANPLSSLPWALIGIVMPSLPALWSPRRQTAFDRLAGTVVVRQK